MAPAPLLVELEELYTRHPMVSIPFWLRASSAEHPSDAALARANLKAWVAEQYRETFISSEFGLLLDACVKHLGTDAPPLLLEGLNATSPVARAVAIERLIALGDPSHASAIADALRRELGNTKACTPAFVDLAARVGVADFREELWPLVTSRKPTVSEPTIKALAASPRALEWCEARLSSDDAAKRASAAKVLGAVRGGRAVALLRARLDVERVPGVRDAIVRALGDAGVTPDRIAAAASLADRERIRAAATKLRGLPARWLSENSLPAMAYTDGAPVEPADVRFLLHRQASQKEPIPDFEALPIYLAIDRRTSGDFAHALLQAFLADSADNADAWALIVAGMLGDARVVTTLASRVNAWAAGFNLKLGQWGVEALEPQGGDAALCAVN